MNIFEYLTRNCQGKPYFDEVGNIYATTKADNIVLNDETHELYLTANGEQIGDKILIDDLTESIITTTATEGLVTMMI